MLKRVITYGTFDLLHYGHINLLRRAKELGDYLIVALSTDDLIKLRGKSHIFLMNKGSFYWNLLGMLIK